MPYRPMILIAFWGLLRAFIHTSITPYYVSNLDCMIVNRLNIFDLSTVDPRRDVEQLSSEKPCSYKSARMLSNSGALEIGRGHAMSSQRTPENRSGHNGHDFPEDNSRTSDSLRFGSFWRAGGRKEQGDSKRYWCEHCRELVLNLQ